MPVLLYQCNGITVATEGFSDPSLLNNPVWDTCADPVCPSVAVSEPLPRCVLEDGGSQSLGTSLSESSV